MKVTLFDINTKVVGVIARVRDLLHHSNGTLTITFDDWSIMEINGKDYAFYTVDK